MYNKVYCGLNSTTSLKENQQIMKFSHPIGGSVQLMSFGVGKASS